jgi:MoxR-like ATPase
MLPIQMDQVASLAKETRAFFDQFKSVFVKRDSAIDRVMYAMMTRQHFLEFGLPGTSKTKICDVIFDHVDDARKFKIEMTAFMDNSSVIGAYDFKAMREEGTLRHNTAGMLPEADIARIGEILDAQPQTLRSLLGALNERRVRNGGQELIIPLSTAYADTNNDPGEYIRSYPKSFAVLDRILLMDQLGYLTDPADIEKMVYNFQRGLIGKGGQRISYKTISQLSSLVVQPPGLITDDSLMRVYAKAAAGYVAERNALGEKEKKTLILPHISDRRIAQASLLIEAAAVLDGRVSVEARDVDAASLALCINDLEKGLWANNLKPLVEEYAKANGVAAVKAISTALQGIEAQLDADVIKAPQTAKAQEIGHTLQVLYKQLVDLQAKNADQASEKTRLQKKFAETAKAVQARFGFTLPEH